MLLFYVEKCSLLPCEMMFWGALQDSTTSRYLTKCHFIVSEIFLNEIEGALGNFGWLVIVCVFINLPCWPCWAHFIKKHQIPQAILWKQQRLRNVHVLCCLVIMSKNLTCKSAYKLQSTFQFCFFVTVKVIKECVTILCVSHIQIRAIL